ncbi:MAG: terminase [Firmicutes bacterium]|nr:terminase [Bacillota bacterium]
MLNNLLDQFKEKSITLNDSLVSNKELAQQSLSEYIKQSWHVLEPGTPYVHNWHIDAIAEHLEAVNKGQIKRLLINIPPRNSKSITTTVMYPTWTWINDPYKRFMSLSYSDRLAKKHNMNRRDIIQSPWYKNNWHNKYRIKGDANRQDFFENDKQGFMYSSGIGGTVTGEGADIIIVDDPHNPKKAESDAERQHAIDFFKMTLPSRINNKKKGVIIVIMQRLHEEDIAGHILANNLGYTHLCLPAIAEEKTIITLPISNKKIIREDGDLLNPSREGKEELEQLKKDMGSYAFAGQYQQDPAPKEGGIFKKHWWKFWKFPGQNLPPVIIKVPYKGYDGEIKYREENVYAIDLPDNLEQSQSWDMSFKKGEHNDYVACGVWAKKNADKFLLDLIEKKLSFTETLKEVRSVTTKWPKTNRKLVEDKANGTAVMDTLKNEIRGIIEINPGSDSKEARAEAVSADIEAGNIYLPHPQLYDWVDDFIDRSAKFPKVKHDDIIDQMTQYLNYINNKPNLWFV